jgi:hypothetical protein
MVKKTDSSLQMRVKQYLITARALPKPKSKEAPKVFSMRVFARNEIIAKSKVW